MKNIGKNITSDNCIRSAELKEIDKKIFQLLVGGLGGYDYSCLPIQRSLAGSFGL